jgi:hypothetical protein
MLFDPIILQLESKKVIIQNKKKKILVAGKISNVIEMST